MWKTITGIAVGFIAGSIYTAFALDKAYKAEGQIGLVALTEKRRARQHKELFGDFDKDLEKLTESVNKTMTNMTERLSERMTEISAEASAQHIKQTNDMIDGIIKDVIDKRGEN